MSFTRWKQTDVLISLLLVVIFAFASIFGAHLTMANDTHGMMPNCSLGDAGILCPMSVSTHINGWQQLFLAVFEKSGGFGVFAAILFFIGFAFFRYLPLRSPQAYAYRPHGTLDNYLFRVIGSGIVHKRE